MRRHYVACNTCGHRRIHLLGKSSEKFGEPAAPTRRYYRCPNCGTEWTYNVQRNALHLGISRRFEQT